MGTSCVTYSTYVLLSNAQNGPETRTTCVSLTTYNYLCIFYKLPPIGNLDPMLTVHERANEPNKEVTRDDLSAWVETGDATVLSQR